MGANDIAFMVPPERSMPNPPKDGEKARKTSLTKSHISVKKESIV
jgi:hypothetical protein